MRFKDEELNTDEQPVAGGGGGLDEENKSLSLMGGIARPEGLAEAGNVDAGGLDDGPARSGVLNQGTLLVAVFLVVGIGSIYLMRAGQGDLGDSSVAKDVEAKIEQALAKLTNPGSLAAGDPLRAENMSALFKNTESVLAMFAKDPVKRQVPIEYVKKDPFDLMIQKDKGPAGPVAKTDDAAELRRKKLALELNGLKLQSVIQGARPTAIISNEIVVPGQRIGSFKVKAIDQFSVTLSADNDVFVLRMDEKAAGRR